MARFGPIGGASCAEAMSEMVQPEGGVRKSKKEVVEFSRGVTAFSSRFQGDREYESSPQGENLGE
jgi:hypothetical protein